MRNKIEFNYIYIDVCGIIRTFFLHTNTHTQSPYHICTHNAFNVKYRTISSNLIYNLYRILKRVFKNSCICAAAHTTCEITHNYTRVYIFFLNAYLSASRGRNKGIWEYIAYVCGKRI